ncbi:hypothetical protein PWY87_08935 [Kribbella solani]|uniref:hypothetical protein n=1 Tax=Kribbella solani TaxID=236067 RepID=UPI0029B3627D|nr:hypothetical protein [Kribbella solani]MDX2973205.1 hypothetical protein [Kribbella solani]MDX3001789.1 hypothetical protein [Kribbella solani]
MSGEMTATVGRDFYVFDGRVLEIFGHGNAIRFHVRHMHVRTTGPNRKGQRIVEIAHGRPESRGTIHVWRYSAAEWEQSPDLAALLQAVQTATAS